MSLLETAEAALAGRRILAVCLLLAAFLVAAAGTVAWSRKRRRNALIRAWAARGTRDIELWLAARSQWKGR